MLFLNFITINNYGRISEFSSISCFRNTLSHISHTILGEHVTLNTSEFLRSVLVCVNFNFLCQRPFCSIVMQHSDWFYTSGRYFLSICNGFAENPMDVLRQNSSKGWFEWCHGYGTFSKSSFVAVTKVCRKRELMR